MQSRTKRTIQRRLFVCVAAVWIISSSAGLLAQWALVPTAPVSASNPVEDWVRAVEDGGEMRAQVLDQARYTYARPAVGDPAADFTLRDLQGKEVRLSDFVGRVPVVMELSSFT